MTGLDRPLGFQEAETPRISRQSAHKGGKAVSPKHRPPLATRRYPWHSFLLEAESTPGHSAVERIKSMKNANGPIGRNGQDHSTDLRTDLRTKLRVLLKNVYIVGMWTVIL
jgi:hypothetical protein